MKPWTVIDLLVRYDFLVAYVLEENAVLLRQLPKAWAKRRAILEAVEAGKSTSAIAREQQISRGSVYRLLRARKTASQ